VPTFKESGIDLTLSLWRGIAVPKGTPEVAIARLEAAFKAASESPAFRDFAGEMGASVEFRGSKAFDQFMAVQDKELAELMDQIGMKKQ
jgi:tripartite-type tricarboxylate transporter receptor subunit TctC